MAEKLLLRRERLTRKAEVKVIVPASAAHSALCSNTCCYKLKHCSCVVIQPPYNHRVNCIFYTHRIQYFLKLFKMLPAFVSQTVYYGRSACYNLFAALLLAVKHPQRVFLIARPAFPAKAVYIAAYKFPQRFVVLCPAFRAAKAVYPQLNILNPKLVNKLCRYRNYLGVKCRRI